MNIQEAEKEYPAIDLYALARQIRVFLEPYYLFVESACLYHGANKQPYHIIFKIPIVPEGQRTQDVPTVQESQDKVELKSSPTPFFCLPNKRKDQDKPQKAPETAAELYEKFFEIIEGPIEFGPLRLDEVYRRDKTNPEPFGSPGYYDWPGSEWAWSIADGNNKLLPEFGVMEDLVLPVDPVLLYEKPNAGNTITAGDKGSTDPSLISPSLEDEVINYCRRNGNFWQIRYEGKSKTISALDGIFYIALLLEKPGTPISCRELYQAVSGRIPDKNKSISEAEVIDEDLNIGSTGVKQIVSDDKAKKDYLKRYQKLQNDLANLDNTPEDMLIRKETEKEMNTLMTLLTNRTFADPDTKKVQANIQKRLNKTYEAIGKAGMKNMEKHLRTHIKPGGSYDLIYTGSLNWDIIR